MRQTQIGLVLSVLALVSLACGLFNQASQISPSGYSNQKPIQVSTASLDASELAVWTELRSGERSLLGDQADGVFANQDIARRALIEQTLADLRTRLGFHPGKAGLQQLDVVQTISALLSVTVELTGQFGDMQTTSQQEFNQDDTRGESKTTVSRQDQTILVEMELNITTTQPDGTQIEENGSGRIEVGVCPDEQGQVKGTVALSMNTGASANGGAYSMQMSLTGDITGEVNDNADLSGYQAGVVTELAQQEPAGSDGSPASNEYVEIAATLTFTADTAGGGFNGESEGGIRRQSSQASRRFTDAVRHASDALAQNLVGAAMNAAQSAWQSGACLEIQLENAEQTNTIKPGDQKQFTASVHHKFEGQELSVPIEAVFNGEKSLQPQGKNPAPVNFTYTAPDEKDKTAILSLESRSRRGVAKLEVSFSTAQTGYTVSGSIDDFKFSGVICDPAQPFTLNGTSSNATAILNFTPSGSSLSGSFTFTGSGQGFSFSGGGPYRILPGDGGNGTLEMNRSGCVDIGTCKSDIDRLPLTPLADSSACK